MPFTHSKEKRAHHAQAMATIPDWTSLPDNLVRQIGDCFMAANDLDYYMDFRAVCQDWRSNTDNPKDKKKDGPEDPRFHPSKWVLLERHEDVDAITLVNVDTGRFLCKNIALLLRYIFLGATGGGLILLGEKEFPFKACVLNPFTGSITHFKARMPLGGIRTVVVTTSPMMVFVSHKADGCIMWADQNSEYFQEFRARYPDEPMCMTSFAGNVYFTNRQGSILSFVVDGATKERSAQTISLTTIISSPNPTQHSYYLVESGGELLRVTGPGHHTPGQCMVHKVDTMRMILEPVSTINNHALFVSYIKCFSVTANKFHTTVDGNCIYVADEFKMEHSTIGGCLRPFTLAQVFVDYCKAIQTSERSLMLDSDGEYYSDSETDESSSEHNE
ncbi:hypothetical protein EJB05_18877, partial [Eragrostis curvula]